jgi:hypothetical protein
MRPMAGPPPVRAWRSKRCAAGARPGARPRSGEHFGAGRLQLHCRRCGAVPWPLSHMHGMHTRAPTCTCCTWPALTDLATAASGRMQAYASRRALCASGAKRGCGERGGEGSSTGATSLPLVFSHLLAQAMGVEKEAWTDFDQVSYESQLRRRIESDVLPQPEDCARWLAASPRIEQAQPSASLPATPPPPPYPPPRTPLSSEATCSE